MDLQLNTLVTRVSYALTRRIALELEAPVRSVKTRAAFEDARGTLRDDFSSIHHRNQTIDGIGDLTLATRWRVSPVSAAAEPTSGSTPRRWLADLVIGVSVPTGKTEEDPFALGAQGLEHEHVFFGSGTVDPSLRLELHRSGQRADIYSWAGGSAALKSNSKGYRRGLSGSAGIGASTTFGMLRTSFQVQLELQYAEPSRWRSQAARNSGGTDVVAALGIAHRLLGGLVLRGQLRIPKNIAAKSGVLEPKTVALLGLSYSR